MRQTRIIATFSATLLPVLLTGAVHLLSSCKKDEPPPPMPATAESTAPPPPTILTVPPPVEDAGEEAGDANADAAHKGVGHHDVSGMEKCCAALAANAASMPPPNNAYAANAAAYCKAAVASINSPQQKDAAIAAIRGALRGASVPAACH